MVKYSDSIDMTFSALADSTRRDILRRSLTEKHTISSLASSYHMSFTAVAKHVKVLSDSGLIRKTRAGREQLIEANVTKLQEIRDLLDSYETLWRERMEQLDTLLIHLP